MDNKDIEESIDSYSDLIQHLSKRTPKQESELFSRIESEIRDGLLKGVVDEVGPDQRQREQGQRVVVVHGESDTTDHALPTIDWYPAGRIGKCNGRLIRELREDSGWSRKQLAERLRTVSQVDRPRNPLRGERGTKFVIRAESGGTILRDQLEWLARALSTPERTVRPSQLVFDFLIRTKQIVDAYITHRGDLLGNIRHFLHDDFVFEFFGDSSLKTFTGKHVGYFAANRVFRELSEVFIATEDISLEPVYFVRGNVVTLWSKEWRCLRGHEPRDSWLTFRFTYNEERLIHLEDCIDTDLIAERLANAKAMSDPTED